MVSDEQEVVLLQELGKYYNMGLRVLSWQFHGFDIFVVFSPGCELNSSARSYTFKVSEEDDSDHILALKTVRRGSCCGVGGG